MGKRSKVPGGGKGKVKSKGKKSSGKTFASAGRQNSRREARFTARQAQAKFHHGGEEAKDATKNRLRVKSLEKQLARLKGDAPATERGNIHREMGHLHVAAGRTRLAVPSYRQALEAIPEDPDYVRTPFLCLLMDQAETEQASELIKGPCFAPILESLGLSLPAPGKKASRKGKKASKAQAEPAKEEKSAKEGQEGCGAELEGAAAAAPAAAGEARTLAPEPTQLAGAASLAATVGCYTLALLTYISVCVLQENCEDPEEAAKSEQRLVLRMQVAKRRNPFVAEYMAFAPAFEKKFPAGKELPSESDCTPAELPIREALQYCCAYGQAGIWLDTDAGVRRFLRTTLFEGEDEEEGPGAERFEEPPFKPLPGPEKGEPDLLAEWRKAREEALDLWASEMSVEGDSSEGEGEEEEMEGDEEEDCEEGSGEEGSEASSEAFAKMEGRRSRR